MPTAFFEICRKQSDIDQDGCLNSAEFPLAMYLIQQSLRGIPLPLYLPQQLHSVYAQVVNPQLPVATDAHLGKCKKAFEAFRQNIGKGVLGGKVEYWEQEPESEEKLCLWTLHSLVVF